LADGRISAGRAGRWPLRGAVGIIAGNSVSRDDKAAPGVTGGGPYTLRVAGARCSLPGPLRCCLRIRALIVPSSSRERTHQSPAIGIVVGTAQLGWFSSCYMTIRGSRLRWRLPLASKHRFVEHGEPYERDAAAMRAGPVPTTTSCGSSSTPCVAAKHGYQVFSLHSLERGRYRRTGSRSARGTRLAGTTAESEVGTVGTGKNVHLRMRWLPKLSEELLVGLHGQPSCGTGAAMCGGFGSGLRERQAQRQEPLAGGGTSLPLGLCMGRHVGTALLGVYTLVFALPLRWVPPVNLEAADDAQSDRCDSPELHPCRGFKPS